MVQQLCNEAYASMLLDLQLLYLHSDWPPHIWSGLHMVSLPNPDRFYLVTR